MLDRVESASQCIMQSLRGCRPAIATAFPSYEFFLGVEAVCHQNIESVACWAVKQYPNNLQPHTFGAIVACDGHCQLDCAPKHLDMWNSWHGEDYPCQLYRGERTQLPSTAACFRHSAVFALIPLQLLIMQDKMEFKYVNVGDMVGIGLSSLALSS